MKGFAITCLLLFSATLRAEAAEATDPSASSAEEEPTRTTPTQEAKSDVAAIRPTTSGERPLYVPPRRGAPATRVGGGTRSGESSMPKISPLSPEHTGMTTQSMPTVYWWLSEDHDGIFEFVVTELDTVQPLLKFRTQGPVRAGVHGFDLAANDVALEPDRVYQWSVAIVRDEQRRSHDIVGIATIELTTSDMLAGSDPAALAAAGIWYDAIAALSNSSGSTDSQQNKAFRADLLEQVGLLPVAEYERSESSGD
jgi:hypothetical protein